MLAVIIFDANLLGLAVHCSARNAVSLAQLPRPATAVHSTGMATKTKEGESTHSSWPRGGDGVQVVSRAAVQKQTVRATASGQKATEDPRRTSRDSCLLVSLNVGKCLAINSLQASDTRTVVRRMVAKRRAWAGLAPRELPPFSQYRSAMLVHCHTPRCIVEKSSPRVPPVR